MGRQYGGMSFSLTPGSGPKGPEEQEMCDILNRHMHEDDLEDDFFSIADGKREEYWDDSDSTVEEVEDTSLSAETLRSSGTWVDAPHEFVPPQMPPAPSPGVKVEAPAGDTLASLISEINAHSKEQFAQLTSLTSKKGRKTRKKPKKTPDYTEYNMILNRLGALYTPVEDVPAAPISATLKPRKRTTGPSQNSCGNWEDVKGSSKHRPNII